MPGLDGFDVLQSLGVEHLPVVIFVTAYDQHRDSGLQCARGGLSDEAVRIESGLQKLWTTRRSFLKVQRDPTQRGIISILEDLRPGARYLERFAIKNGETVFFVRADEVDAVEAEGNYVRLRLGNSSHLLRETLTNIEEQLNPQVFVRIHRRTIVNINRVKELQTGPEVSIALCSSPAPITR
jgi:two-component system LytT family response regulator